MSPLVLPLLCCGGLPKVFEEWTARHFSMGRIFIHKIFNRLRMLSGLMATSEKPWEEPPKRRLLKTNNVKKKLCSRKICERITKGGATLKVLLLLICQNMCSIQHLKN